jgi:hypothetical protein
MSGESLALNASLRHLGMVFLFAFGGQEKPLKFLEKERDRMKARWWKGGTLFCDNEQNIHI